MTPPKKPSLKDMTNEEIKNQVIEGVCSMVKTSISKALIKRALENDLTRLEAATEARVVREIKERDLLGIIRALRQSVRPIENHPDPESITDCFNEAEDIVQSLLALLPPQEDSNL